MKISNGLWVSVNLPACLSYNFDTSLGGDARTGHNAPVHTIVFSVLTGLLCLPMLTSHCIPFNLGRGKFVHQVLGVHSPAGTAGRVSLAAPGSWFLVICCPVMAAFLCQASLTGDSRQSAVMPCG